MECSTLKLEMMFRKADIRRLLTSSIYRKVAKGYIMTGEPSQ
jgi:hypothetical protein